jgi:endonuclease/exonuclease/phosphatase family metal-dependent hydrolase
MNYQQKYLKYKEKYLKYKSYVMNGGNYVENLKQSFINFINKNENTLSARGDGEYRIATYNVHYFTDVHEAKETKDIIIGDIANIDANALVLQEILVGGDNIKINNMLSINLGDLYNKISTKTKYSKKIVCNSVPSWYDGIYGNMMLINDNCDKVCTKLEENIYTFDKSNETVTVSGKNEGTKETRCYMYIHSVHSVVNRNYNIHIFGTHLDVASEAERLSQIKIIINHARKFNGPNDVVFICGDFNTFDRNDFSPDDPLLTTNQFTKNNGDVIKELKHNNYIDCHSNDKIAMTTWNGTRVDFIMCNKNISGYRAEYYYTLGSDHLPVILTLQKDFMILNN